jgi:ABC-type nitrate/sulfonate/bicarbonate transport system ATPase subunit
MDELFVLLNKTAADRLRLLLVGLVSARPTTVLFVTHDAGEAIALADRILILSTAPGRVAAEMPIRLPGERRRDPAAAATLQAEFARRAADIPSPIGVGLR